MKKKIPKSVLLYLCAMILLMTSGIACSSDEDQFYVSALSNKDNAGGISMADGNFTRKLDVQESNFKKGQLSEMLDIYEVIYLDNTVPVGKVSKILFLNDKLCIFDQDITNTVNVFDRNGRHLRTIGRKGEGPGEYKKIHDVQVNPYTHLIDIWDGTSQKILSYNEMGNLLNERKVDIYASSFGIIDSATYVFYKGNTIVDPALDYKLIAIDVEEQAVSGKLFKIRPEESTFSVQDPSIILNYNSANGKHYFTRLFDDRIYSIKNQQLTAEYFIDFKNKALDVNRINFNQDKNKIINNWIFNPQYFSLLGNIMEAEDRLFFTFNKGVQVVYGFHHKRSGQSYYFDELWNDITGTAMLFPLNADTEGNVYFADEPGMYTETVRVKAKYKNISEAAVLEEWKKEKPLGYEIYNRISDFDNPIILVGRYTFE